MFVCHSLSGTTWSSVSLTRCGFEICFQIPTEHWVFRIWNKMWSHSGWRWWSNPM